MGEGNRAIILGWLRDQEAAAKRARYEARVQTQVAETAEAAAAFLREQLALPSPTHPGEQGAG